jgi:hypothetical protein
MVSPAGPVIICKPRERRMGEGYFEEIRGFVIEVTAWAGNQQRIPLSLSGPASFSSRRFI